jgi:hypothetical protein
MCVCVCMCVCRHTMKTRRRKKVKTKDNNDKTVERETVDLTDDDLPVELVKWKEHYGSNDTEIGEYLRLANLGEDVRIIDAPSSSLYHDYKIETGGQCLVFFQTAGSSHWVALCIDFDYRVYGTVGIRGDHTFDTFLKGQRVDLTGFIRISPGLASQNESECGARVAVYCHWFASERTRTRLRRRELEETVSMFHANVEELMAKWRRDRIT